MSKISNMEFESIIDLLISNGCEVSRLSEEEIERIKSAPNANLRKDSFILPHKVEIFVYNDK